jgi:hypothetical protein
MSPKPTPGGDKVLFHANDFNYSEFVAEQEDGPSPLPAVLPAAEAEALLAQAAGDAKWDAFYQRETDPYKPRRYLTAEFPELLQTAVALAAFPAAQEGARSPLSPLPLSAGGLARLRSWMPAWLPRRVDGCGSCGGGAILTRPPLLLDVGCGYGSSLLPLLKVSSPYRAPSRLPLCAGGSFRLIRKYTLFNRNQADC